jgi:hypothetical protein
MREMPYGKWLWIANMVVLGVGGVLRSWKNISRGWGELSCLATLNLRWEMAPKFGSDMMFGVGIKLSRHLFWTCLELPLLRMQLW